MSRKEGGYTFEGFSLIGKCLELLRIKKKEASSGRHEKRFLSQHVRSQDIPIAPFISSRPVNFGVAGGGTRPARNCTVAEEEEMCERVFHVVIPSAIVLFGVSLIAALLFYFYKQRHRHRDRQQRVSVIYSRPSGGRVFPEEEPPWWDGIEECAGQIENGRIMQPKRVTLHAPNALLSSPPSTPGKETSDGPLPAKSGYFYGVLLASWIASTAVVWKLLEKMAGNVITGIGGAKREEKDMNKVRGIIKQDKFCVPTTRQQAHEVLGTFPANQQQSSPLCV